MIRDKVNAQLSSWLTKCGPEREQDDAVNMSETKVNAKMDEPNSSRHGQQIVVRLEGETKMQHEQRQNLCRNDRA